MCIYIYLNIYTRTHTYDVLIIASEHFCKLNPRYQWCNWLQRLKGSLSVSAKDGSISQRIGYQGSEPEC